MMTLQRLVLIAVLGFTLVFGYELRLGARAAVERIISVLEFPGAMMKTLNAQHRLTEYIQFLEKENHELGAVIFALRQGIDVTKKETMIRAPVDARSVFNNGNSLTIGAGEEQGVSKGVTVLVMPHLFLGKIRDVNKKWSVAETVYDHGYTMPVRIGTSGVAGLLVGGRVPRVTMIDKNKIIHEGDAIYTADKTVPYGLKIGTVKKIIDEPTNAFHEIEIVLPYEIDDVEFVFITI